MLALDLQLALAAACAVVLSLVQAYMQQVM
jgi:hypothetical protein